MSDDTEAKRLRRERTIAQLRFDPEEAVPLGFLGVFVIYASLALIAMFIAFLVIWTIARPFEVASFVAGGVATGAAWQLRGRLLGLIASFRHNLHHA